MICSSMVSVFLLRAVYTLARSGGPLDTRSGVLDHATPMKIERVETSVINMPMVIDGATPMLGGRARTSIDMLLVRVDTDAGITGWGEAFGHRIFPATRAAIDTLLGPMCVGRDATQ